MDSQFSTAIARLLTDLSTPKEIRAIEQGAPWTSLWKAVEESGFADALVPEDRGGGGLAPADVFGVLLACGRHALPVPLGPAMFARAALAQAEREIPAGPLTIAASARDCPDGSLQCARVPFARASEWVLADLGETLALLAVREAAILPAANVYGSLEADLRWSGASVEKGRLARSVDLRAMGACLFATHIAGAMERILEDTVRYANERSQFGKSIGKFQAIQQQVSVMSEQVFASRMAAQLGCGVAGFQPTPLLCAVAKARTSEAVVPVANAAHAVHGAIGMTEEYDLQLYTRRLHEWRLAFGSEAYWQQRIGEALCCDPASSTLEFIRGHLAPVATELSH
ncbi:MAG: acyl-CoA dehydrogenase [Deltaproteobacteria bacterium]|nr:acyl-CoA dehydrogenase [Deltaproteobacteria bacterium]